MIRSPRAPIPTRRMPPPSNRPAPLATTLGRAPEALRPLMVRGLIEGLAAQMRWPPASEPRVKLVFIVPDRVLESAALRRVIRPDRLYRFESADGRAAVTGLGSELVEFLDRLDMEARPGLRRDGVGRRPR